MVIALPGLLDHDRGRLANSLDRADAFFASSYNVLGEAAGAAPTDHPVHLYIVMAQLQTLNSWAYAIDRLGRKEGMSPVTRSNLLSGNVHSRVPKPLCSITVLWNNNTTLLIRLQLNCRTNKMTKKNTLKSGRLIVLFLMIWLIIWDQANQYS